MLAGSSHGFSELSSASPALAGPEPRPFPAFEESPAVGSMLFLSSFFSLCLTEKMFLEKKLDKDKIFECLYKIGTKDKLPLQVT